MSEEEKLEHGFTNEEAETIDRLQQQIDGWLPKANAVPEPTMCVEKFLIGAALNEIKKIFAAAQARRTAQ